LLPFNCLCCVALCDFNIRHGADIHHARRATSHHDQEVVSRRTCGWPLLLAEDVYGIVGDGTQQRERAPYSLL